jgi:hypothetical protein
MVKLRGSNIDHRAPGARTDEPLHTISAQGQHHGEVRAFLVKYFGTEQDPRLNEPMHTVTTKHRFGLVTVHGEQYAIVDIGMRMLSARELYTAQGFPTDYVIEWGIDPYTGQVFELTKTAQVRMCGNSVCPQLAQAIAAANYAEQVAIVPNWRRPREAQPTTPTHQELVQQADRERPILSWRERQAIRRLTKSWSRARKQPPCEFDPLELRLGLQADLRQRRPYYAIWNPIYHELLRTKPALDEAWLSHAARRPRACAVSRPCAVSTPPRQR